MDRDACYSWPANKGIFKIEMTLQFVTLTGADDRTSLEDIRTLASKAGVPPFFCEVAVLLSKSRSGSPRYPSVSQANAIVRESYYAGLRCSVHVCGSWARDLVNDDVPEELQSLFRSTDRIQINGVFDRYDTDPILNLLSTYPVEVIFQSRSEDSFPPALHKRIVWLFDQSGGNGDRPSAWPSSSRRCGFAGGISADNVKEVLLQIGDRPYPFWIDMESSLRDEQDRFSIPTCLEILRIAKETCPDVS